MAPRSRAVRNSVRPRGRRRRAPSRGRDRDSAPRSKTTSLTPAADRALGEQLADLGRRGRVGAGLQLRAQVLVERRGGGERLPVGVVDDLGIDVLRRAEDAEAQPAVRRPCGLRGGRGRCGELECSWPWLAPLLLLAFLAEDLLVGVFHALALVGLGLAELADLGGDLADLLLVDAGDDDLGRLRRCDRDARPGSDRRPRGCSRASSCRFLPCTAAR